MAFRHFPSTWGTYVQCGRCSKNRWAASGVGAIRCPCGWTTAVFNPYNAFQPNPLEGPETKPEPIRKVQGAVRLFRMWRLGDSTPVEARCPCGCGIVLNANTVNPNGTDLRLWAINMHFGTWVPGENTARDANPEGNAGYGQGFYGFKSYGTMFSQDSYCRDSHQGFVAGTILAYGRVHIHEHGARAERAIIESLIEPEDFNEAFKVVGLADHYKCRVISEDAADNLAGGLVPYQKGMEL